MNAQELANVLQKVKADPVLQETLRVTKQNWVELNLTTQETLQALMNITSAPDLSDSEIEYNCTAWTLIAVSRGCSLRRTCQPCTIACLQ
jgi:hypothetical protein